MTDYKAGTDYDVLDNPQPAEAGIGKKVEVIEFFGYIDPASAAMEPLLKWQTSDDVSFRRVPADLGGRCGCRSSIGPCDRTRGIGGPAGSRWPAAVRAVLDNVVRSSGAARRAGRLSAAGA